ncbi:MAG: murein biosynthesis integral membrane protein MurJ [Solirubrobacterales bacterium]|nr:murein biosynthesis integral membrane protein MurJ [Solirubrobacterales bacterium]
MGESRDPVQPEAAFSAPSTGSDALTPEEEHAATGRRLGRSTAFFSIATGLSRVAGLVREIFAASYFGVGIQMSAFTIAFLVPNLVRSLFADAALQAAFVPVFTEQLERGRKVEAFRLASTLIFGALLVLGLITAIFILAAPVLMPLFAPGYSGEELDLTVALSRILFPILVMLGVSGIVVGVLNSYNRFGVFAIAPLFWNLAIIAVLVGLAPAFPDGDEIYAYAIGVVVGTILQLAMVAYDLRNTPLRLSRVFEWRSDLVKRVLLLMLPVTISLGLINFNLAINGIFGSLVPGQGEDAPAAIDKAFRIYMLPQGMFSVAVATVVFPTLARFAARRAYDDLRSTVANGMRMILLVLVPAAAAIFVLSEPMVRIVYERGDFSAGDTDLVSTALFWFAFSLPFNGLFLLLTRTFFSLQRPWIPTAISGLNLLITAGVSLALYKPYGVAGIVGATALATFASVIAQVVVLRRELGGIEFGSLLDGAVRIVAASVLLAGVSYLVWNALDGALGMGTLAQIGSLSAGLAAGGMVYLGGVLAMRVPEARQLLGVLRR